MTKKAQNGQALEMVFQKYDVMSNDDINLKKEILDILKKDQEKGIKEDDLKKLVKSRYFKISIIVSILFIIAFITELFLIKFGFTIDPNILKISAGCCIVSIINWLLLIFYKMGFLFEVICLALVLLFLYTNFPLPETFSPSLKQDILRTKFTISLIIAVICFSSMLVKYICSPTKSK
jgi:hypothetical protein